MIIGPQVLDCKQGQVKFVDRVQDAGKFGLVADMALQDCNRTVRFRWRRRYLHRAKTVGPVRPQMSLNLDPVVSGCGEMCLAHFDESLFYEWKLTIAIPEKTCIPQKGGKGREMSFTMHRAFGTKFPQL